MQLSCCSVKLDGIQVTEDHCYWSGQWHSEENSWSSRAHHYYTVGDNRRTSHLIAGMACS
eukprot:Awhi_evm1s8641